MCEASAWPRPPREQHAEGPLDPAVAAAEMPQQLAEVPTGAGGHGDRQVRASMWDLNWSVCATISAQ